MIPVRMFLALFLATLALAPTASAASVRVDPESAAVYRGQTLTLRYTVFGADQPPSAPEINLTGATVDYVGLAQSSSVQIINGRRTASASFTYSYSVTPHGVGTFKIPPVQFRLRTGEALTARTVTILVTEAPESDDFRLRLEASEDELYVGQPVTITWTLLFGRDFNGAELEWPAPPAAEVHLSAESDPEFSPRKPTATLMGQPVALTESRVREDGRVWRTYTADVHVVPTRPGTLVIPAATAVVEAGTGRIQQGLAGLRGREATEIVRARAEQLAIPVRPLPSEGRPADFTGLVGEFSLSAAATPASVRVGDPVELTVLVRGPEPLTALPPLELSSAPGFESRFRIDGDGEAAERGRGVAVFTRTLRAIDDAVDAVPAIEIPYFDPELGRYAVARSSPVPLEVAPTRVVTLADAQGGAGATSSSRAIGSRRAGLTANVVSPRALEPDPAGLRALALAPATIAALAAPPSLCAIAGVVALVRRRRHAAGAAAGARRALPDALDALARAAEPADVHQALADYAARRWPGASILTIDALERRLRELDPSLATELERLRTECDAARFGATRVDASALARRAAEFLEAADRRAAEVAP